MLKAVEILAPTIYPFVHSVYSSPSSLVWGDKTISSSEGVQQGDPLGPLLFCLSIHHHCTFLSAEFCVMNLDDITLRGSMAEIGHDLEVIESLPEVELCLNTQKSDIICNNPVTREAINMMLPGARLIDPSSSCLLGSALGDVDCISGALREKISSLEVWVSECNTSQLMMASSSETPFPSQNFSMSSGLPPVFFPPLSLHMMIYSSRS